MTNDDDEYDRTKHFAVICLKCGSSNVEVELEAEHYEDTGLSAKIIFDCQNCQHNFDQY